MKDLIPCAIHFSGSGGSAAQLSPEKNFNNDNQAAKAVTATRKIISLMFLVVSFFMSPLAHAQVSYPKPSSSLVGWYLQMYYWCDNEFAVRKNSVAYEDSFCKSKANFPDSSYTSRFENAVRACTNKGISYVYLSYPPNPYGFKGGCGLEPNRSKISTSNGAACRGVTPSKISSYARSISNISWDENNNECSFHVSCSSTQYARACQAGKRIWLANNIKPMPALMDQHSRIGGK